MNTRQQVIGRRQLLGGAVALGLILAGGVSPAAARSVSLKDVEIRVLDDRRRPFREVAATDIPRSRDHRAYLEAVPDARYQIEVRNRSNRRVGLVIAVDGRNIISGDRSDLRPNERMYVLEPGKRGRYEGWRTGRDQVNRFVFTQADRSYAAAWGDNSAMGVIAVAVFAEEPPVQIRSEGAQVGPSLRSAPAAPSAEMGARAGAAPSAQVGAGAAAGTGYGETVESASRTVAFKPEKTASAQYFYKYEWRAQLCDRGVIRCDRDRRPEPDNRFWPEDDGFAPPPPRR